MKNTGLSRPSVRSMTGGIIILAVIFFFSGCRTTTHIQSENLHLPENSVVAPPGSSGDGIVYAVKTTHMANHLEIRQFGIYHDTAPDIRIRHGLSYTMYLDPNNTRLETALNYILKRHGYDAVNAFKAAYAGSRTISPDIPYAALPQKFGHDLYRLAQRANDWDAWIIMHGVN